MDLTFQPWPKIPRLRRDMTITEKIDGTNAAVGIAVVPLGEVSELPATYVGLHYDNDGEPDGSVIVYAQSRKRLITPEDDNYGFAGWTWSNANELVRVLGPGLHFGEWWGQGIQRSYGLDHKRFSLFNTSRWGWLNDPEAREAKQIHDQLWSVPVLKQSVFSTSTIRLSLAKLGAYGSHAAPGFKNPEGVIVYHHAANSMFKLTLEGDDQAKGE